MCGPTGGWVYKKSISVHTIYIWGSRVKVPRKRVTVIAGVPGRRLLGCRKSYFFALTEEYEDGSLYSVRPSCVMQASPIIIVVCLRGMAILIWGDAL